MTALLDIQDLKVHFHTRDGVVKAVDGVSLRIEPGQVAGIVGESGSGKSVTAYSLLGLIPMPPGRIEGGRALFQGTDLLRLGERELNTYRGRKISMIFQDPMTSLNPYLKVSTQLVEPLEIHENLTGRKALHRAIEALEHVGIENAATRIHGYPHEFSGGMRQRVMIAMALITKPDLLIADEPTTALDVTVQKQVLDVIRMLQRETGTAVIFITHDLAVVHEMCDTVNVLYAGRVIESAPASELIRNPLHAYTRGLYRSNPSARPKGEDLHTIPGLPPDLARLPAGCSFRPRIALWPPASGQYPDAPSFQLWQLLTYGFLHGSVGHLFFNMLALFMFGGEIERLLESRHFLVYYLACVIGAAITQLLVTGGSQQLPIPTVGASGGVFGLLLAFGLAFPKRRIMLLFPPIPMPAWLFVTLYGLLELYLGVTGSGQGVAHFAHLGGMAAGYVLLTYWTRGRLHR